LGLPIFTNYSWRVQIGITCGFHDLLPGKLALTIHEPIDINLFKEKWIGEIGDEIKSKNV